MFKKLLPKEIKFFDYFEQHGSIICRATELFREMVRDPSKIAEYSPRIKEVEHQADDVTHACIEALHKTFITPIDRHDIHSLTKRMDDIVDEIDAAATRFLLYDIKEVRSEAVVFADILVQSSAEILKGLASLRHLDQAKTILDTCIRIHKLENDGDAALREGLRKLFQEEKDPITIIKWKEIYELLEQATDRCEDVANIMEGIVIEAS